MKIIKIMKLVIETPDMIFEKKKKEKSEKKCFECCSRVSISGCSSGPRFFQVCWTFLLDKCVSNGLMVRTKNIGIAGKSQVTKNENY